MRVPAPQNKSSSFTVTFVRHHYPPKVAENPREPCNIPAHIHNNRPRVRRGTYLPIGRPVLNPHGGNTQWVNRQWLKPFRCQDTHIKHAHCSVNFPRKVRGGKFLHAAYLRGIPPPLPREDSTKCSQTTGGSTRQPPLCKTFPPAQRC